MYTKFHFSLTKKHIKKKKIHTYVYIHTHTYILKINLMFGHLVNFGEVSWVENFSVSLLYAMPLQDIGVLQNAKARGRMISDWQECLIGRVL